MGRSRGLTGGGAGADGGRYCPFGSRLLRQLSLRSVTDHGPPELGDPMRDRYFDTLRAAAIVRVVLYHAFPFAALELVFPSMGVMFALGGSLMVKSIDRSAAGAV